MSDRTTGLPGADNDRSMRMLERALAMLTLAVGVVFALAR